MHMPRNPAFCRALVTGRNAAGLTTQAAFARAAGIAAADACRYERGVRIPTLMQFARITRLAGLDPIPLLAAIDDDAAATERPTNGTPQS